MTMCDQCVNAIDERHGWEVLHKCRVTGELRPYRLKNCSNYERNKRIDGEPRTSAENNDQIAYGHIAENDENE